jgi:hypothetical protein
VTRDAAQLRAERAGHHGGIELGAFAHDRLNGVDVVGDQLRRDPIEVGRVFDDATKTFGGDTRGREAERGGVAFDVVGGAKQLLAIVDGETAAQNGRMRCREPVGLDRHPVLEFAGQSGERLFRAPDGIIEVGFGNAQQHLAQGVGLRDHMMVGEAFDL